MRVLFTTYPEKTHFLAMAPLAWALRTAGHEVCFASAPKFSDVITQAGLTAVPVGSNRDLWQIMTNDLEWLTVGMNGIPVPYDAADWPEEQVTHRYLKFGYELHVPRWHKMSNVPLIPDLVAFAQYWQPDLVVWEPSTYAGAIAAGACGAAHARLLFSLDTYGVVRERYVRLNAEEPPERRADPLAAWLAPYGARYGFAFDEEVITGQRTITLVPPSLSVQADLHYLPMRYTPYGGPAVVPSWLHAEPARPRVAVTMGISTADLTGEAVDLAGIFAALGELDVEVVATLSIPAQQHVPDPPANLRMESFVPLSALVPSCAAVMHHGGIGTLLSTAIHGKPQLIVPWNADGPALAQKVAAHGNGLALHPAQASPALVRDRVLRLLDDPRFTERAADLRAEVAAMPTPNAVVDDLEELVAERGRGAGSARRATAGGA